MKALANVLGIGVGTGLAFGMMVVSPEPEALLLGGLLAFQSDAIVVLGATGMMFGRKTLKTASPYATRPG